MKNSNGGKEGDNITRSIRDNTASGLDLRDIRLLIRNLYNCDQLSCFCCGIQLQEDTIIVFDTLQ